jgi:glucose-6-phosphate isomerase
VLADSSELASGGVPSDAIVVELTSTADLASGEFPSVAGSLGEQFVVWQWATAMAGYLLGTNPFDQPDVESAKSAARNLLSDTPEAPSPAFIESGVTVSSHHLELDSTDRLAGLWQKVSDRARHGYIALQVYANRENSAQWQRLRRILAARSQRPVTLGFGPRFLHSTGQFHKGGRPSGVFVQVEVTAGQDLEIPDFPFGFGTLIDAQSAGDRQVLAERGLPIVTLRVSDEAALQALLGSIGQK